MGLSQYCDDPFSFCQKPDSFTASGYSEVVSRTVRVREAGGSIPPTPIFFKKQNPAVSGVFSTSPIWLFVSSEKPESHQAF